METVNLPKKTSKKNQKNKETKAEKPILSFSINHDSIV